MIPCDKNEPQKSTEPVKTCWFYCHKELRSYREYRHVMHFFFFKNRPHMLNFSERRSGITEKFMERALFPLLSDFELGVM